MMRRYSLKSELLFWLSKETTDTNITPRNQSEKDNGVKALIRFGGLPSLNEYDNSFPIPQYPDALVLSDNSPSDRGTAYIG